MAVLGLLPLVMTCPLLCGEGGRTFLPGVPNYISGRENNCSVSSAVESHETFFTEIERDMVSVVNMTTAMTDLHVGN